MRHGFAFRKLSRNNLKRSRLLDSLATSLFEHERIQTTMARAKELKRVADKLITLAKSDKENSHLRIFDQIQKPEVGSKLITSIAPRYKDRAGGYTRIWNAGLRQSDKAPIAIIELVDNHFDLKAMFSEKSNT